MVLDNKVKKAVITMDIVTPTEARANLLALIQATNRDSAPILIAGADNSKSAVLMGKQDYDALQETMALFMNGQMQATLSRENDESVDLARMIAAIEHA
ncbi:type II toxin-antitoxin system Phd/YefM family antitoxin [Periweissella ghanensis]|uniref:Antitoxin n=1 Tax=Periweissella ghanensis TaxID=467997 RepID=A0ABM8Z9I4_9LACO|nr:type II toxin-antitoxin system Phd/YefM family antitoxin [Periweissella ghanensis]CAH0418012.1 hypothetical protein WGH24286_00428 [Periweissella ghanensis]